MNNKYGMNNIPKTEVSSNSDDRFSASNYIQILFRGLVTCVCELLLCVLNKS